METMGKDKKKKEAMGRAREKREAIRREGKWGRQKKEREIIERLMGERG